MSKEVRESYQGAVCPYCYKKDYNADMYFKGNYDAQDGVDVECPNCLNVYRVKQVATVKYVSETK